MIAFNRPFVGDRELDYIRKAFASGRLSGDGEFGRRCEALLQELVGCERALLAPSCTSALEMAAVLLDLAPGDEVLVPSFTFVSSANAFVLLGARPVFVDVDPLTLNIDPADAARKKTARCRAVVVVHYAGVGAPMDELSSLGLPIVEDNAHGLFGTYRGKPLGSLGSLATLSFHDTKNISCGEGGALLVNDPSLVSRAEVVREKGTDRSKFFKGLVDKYTWVDRGSSYLLSEIGAAVLLAQLEQREAIQAARQAVWQRYFLELQDWALRTGVQLPAVPSFCEHPAHLFYLLHPEPAQRDAFLAHLRARGVGAVFHYIPLHSSPMGRSFEGDCPVSERVAARLTRLPLYPDLGADQDRVIEAVVSFS
jgi:dTDP-4-amino-4,6-dideoxygalactose transaminase